MARSSRSPRVAPSDRRPHFFKVFFPELYSENLRIPPMFREHIEGEGLPNTVSLKGPSGSIWYVDLVKNSNVLFFENGWKEFVRDHSIRLGDFLLFRYDGNLHFIVLVFDNTGCEKAEAFSARPCQDDITVLDAIADGGSVGEEASRPLVVSRNGTVRVTPKRNRGSDDCLMLEGPARKKLSRCKKSQDRRKTSPRCRQAPNSLHSRALLMAHKAAGTPKQVGRTRSPSSSGKTLRKNPISSNRYIEFVDKAKLKSRSGQVAKASPQSTASTPQSSSSEKLNYSIKTNVSMLPCKVPSKRLPLIKSSQEPRPGEAVDRIGISVLKSQRRPVTLEELHMTLEKAETFKSTNCFFRIKMCNAYVYSGFLMHIPRDFMTYFPKDSGWLTLWDPNGKSWEVKFITDGDRGGLSGGWRKFSYTNNLETGDVCVFEVIKKNQIRVHIFRVVEELTPLIRISRGRS